MKVKIKISFAYCKKPENEQKKTVINLLQSFAEYCENTDFEFQCIPRMGEEIIAEKLIRKWLECKRYKKPNPDTYLWKEIYIGFTTGSFMVKDVYHSLDSCTIHCSDVDCKE